MMYRHLQLKTGVWHMIPRLIGLVVILYIVGSHPWSYLSRRYTSNQPVRLTSHTPLSA